MLVSDPITISTYVDAVIVAPSTARQKRIWQKASRKLKQVNANIIGAVMNKYPSFQNRATITITAAMNKTETVMIDITAILFWC